MSRRGKPRGQGSLAAPLASRCLCEGRLNCYYRLRETDVGLATHYLTSRKRLMMTTFAFGCVTLGRLGGGSYEL
jgi:hypothetical protein